jgi:phenylalanyl-tRNA synthetase beta chain
MKISYNWLTTLINSDKAPGETAALLTDSGLEVEGVEKFESVPGGLRGLVVGEVIECAKHPDADRLSLTKVNVGGAEPLSIVCGASNVAAGLKVIVATVGTKLFPSNGEPFEIKRSKIRGATSEGMICAEDEIGLGTGHEGIMVLSSEAIPGTPAAEYFKIETDTILEIGLTPNRSDAASHLGVARDLATVLNTSSHSSKYKVQLQGLHALPEVSDNREIRVSVHNHEACRRYSGIVIQNVRVLQSPDWLRNRLKSIGIRPINNIVDITNFVLHELGQPLHAFDLGRIKGGTINVRTAKEGERFISLDGIERKLRESDLVISDEKDPICLAGIYGGIESGVTEQTTDIFLESAFFDATFIRRTSKHHGLKTDASFRFERGTDPEITVTALIRAANLVLETAGGTASAVTDIYPEKLMPYKVAFSYLNCTELIGKEIDRHMIKDIILHLGIEIESEGSDGLLLLVPRYKTDVTREIDVIEEVMRIYGYNNVDASRHITYTAHNEEKNPEVALEEKAGAVLEGFGFSEIMGLSLTKEAYYKNDSGLVKILNPLSHDLNVLRGDMIFSGLEAIAYNINRKNANLKFFEAGRTYLKNEGGYEEQKNISIFITGRLFSENPYHLNQVADFSFLRSATDQLLAKCGLTAFKTSESTEDKFQFGLSYAVNKKPLAALGAVANGLLSEFGIEQPVFYCCINWHTLLQAFSKHSITFEEPARFPFVRRDLALLIDKSVKFKEVEDLAFSTEKKFLKAVTLFDIYENEKLGNKRSYAVRFTLLDNEATLTDKQIDNVMAKLITGYKEKLGAELR